MFAFGPVTVSVAEQAPCLHLATMPHSYIPTYITLLVQSTLLHFIHLQTPDEFWQAYEDEIRNLNYPHTEAISQAR